MIPRTSGKARTDHQEMKDQLANITVLGTILPQNSNIVLKSNNESASFMALSRHLSGIEDGPRKERAHKHEHSVSNTDKHSAINEEVSVKSHTSDVVSLSSNSVNNDKKQRYALSLATLASKPSKRLTIVNEGAITLLIELSSIHDKAVQIRCASAFASLSIESSIRRRMIEEGVVTAIVSLVTNCNLRDVKADCGRAICNLCCEVGYEFKMVKEGIPYVVTHIATSCSDAYDVCLKILMNLTCVKEKYARIEDITEALIYFTSNSLSLNYEQELLLLSAFRNLASLKNNQLRLVEDGCLKIVEKFYQSEYGKFRRIATDILKNLTTDSKTRLKLLEQNILPILLQMYHDPDEEIRMLCAKSFLNLMEEEKFRYQIVEGEALQNIIHLSNASSASASTLDNIEMYQVIAKTLRKLCGDRNIAQILVEYGVGKAIINLLKIEDNLIHQYCAEALCGLFQTYDILERLVQDGAAQHLISLANQTTNPLTSDWCSYALFQFSKSNVSGIASNQILPCIIHLCEANYTTDITKRFCSAAFAYATQSKTFDCSDAIPLLVKMLRDETSQIIKKYCATSLFNLADSQENCFQMLESQALLPVVQLTQSEYISGDSDPKVICAGIISCLSLHKKYYDQFATGNVLKVLLELSCVDHRLTQRRVVIALSNLSQDETLKFKLLELNPIPYIISLASERDEYLRRGCISIVCNMSFIPGSEKAIVDAGIMPTLMITSLITSDQMTSKIICVKALVNLMADRSLYKSMVKDGIIWGLSKLAQLENQEMLYLCAKALCCLSSDFAREMLSSTVVVRTLLRFINTSDIELMTYGARMLTNILLKTNQNDEQFHKIVVDSMLPLANSNDKELNELCVICLCLASQSESSRTGIVSSGMLQMIDAGTIFADTTVSYAYITMFGNIANNPVMRNRVLDKHMIERFRRICESKIYPLDLAVVKALYCLSCSTENIPKLVDQNIIPFIESMTELNYGVGDTKELLSHLIACLYNLTTVIEVQHKLVTQGFVEVMKSLWEISKKDKDLCILSYLAICHLACGRTNSSQMVSDGCTSMLCFLSEYKTKTAYQNYDFSVEVHYRASAAIRNLLTVIANQRLMVDQNCLQTVIDLAHFSMNERLKVHQPSDPLFGNHEGIWRNCFAALSSLTYNQEVRDVLLQSEAINIILSNSESNITDITSLGHGLLKELEAESWDNGARGKIKDGRSKSVAPAKLYTEFLRGGSDVKLNISIKASPLEKFCVQIQLNDPDLAPLDDLTGAFNSSQTMQSSDIITTITGDPTQIKLEYTQQMLDAALSIEALRSHQDSDEISSSTVYFNAERQSCTNIVETNLLFRVDENVDNNIEVNKSFSLGGSIIEPPNSLNTKLKLLSEDSFSDKKIVEEQSLKNQSPTSTTDIHGVNHLKLPSLAIFAKKMQEDIQIKKVEEESLPKLLAQKAEKERLKKKKLNLEKQTSKLLHESIEDKEFLTMVNMIKKVKSSRITNKTDNVGSLDDVLDKWRDYSRY